MLSSPPGADVRRSRQDLRATSDLDADVADLIVNIGVPILGIVIVNKAPRNAIGWVFIVAGAALALAIFGQAYALHVLVADPGSLPAGRALAWLSNVLWPIPIVCLTLLFLLFPTGHLPSPRWRPVVWLVGVILVLLTAASLILATASWSTRSRGSRRRRSAGDIARVAIVIAVLAEIVALLLSVVSRVFRYRRSTGAERPSSRGSSRPRRSPPWRSASVLLRLGRVSAIVSISLVFLYVAIGIAMLKHNLYDIDLIINKTITYGALAAFITAIYVIVVVVIGAFIGVTEGVSLVATAIVAVAFQPIRRQAQQIANRLVYGERATPYEVLSRFSEHVGETYSGEDILVRMARLLAEGTGATSAVVWLRVGDEIRPAATWPTNGAMATAIPLVADDPPIVDGATVSIPVRHQRELLGLLTVTKPPNEALSPVEENRADLAAGRSSRESRRLRISRLTTADGGSRTGATRLERNLNTGAAALVALAVRLRRARRPRRRTSRRPIGCWSSWRAT